MIWQVLQRPQRTVPHMRSQEISKGISSESMVQPVSTKDYRQTAENLQTKADVKARFIRWKELSMVYRT
jgi:hypothetical protein